MLLVRYIQNLKGNLSAVFSKEKGILIQSEVLNVYEVPTCFRVGTFLP